MELVFLGIVFLTIICLLMIRRPLYQAILGGVAVTILLYRIPLGTAAGQVTKVVTSWSSMSMLASMYLITYLQKMLENRHQITLASQDLNGIFHNRRVNAALASVFIGLLPSAPAMILCGDIVKDATDGYLEPKEQAFVTSWFRHIPESTLPTYASVILMANLSGVPLPSFMIGMVVPLVILCFLGYWPYLRRLPRDPGTPKSENRALDVLHLFQHLWTIMLAIFLILACGLSVVSSVLVTIVIAMVVYRFRPKNMASFVKPAFELKMMLNIFLVMVLKEFISCTGVLEILPGLLSKLPIPTYLVFVVLFFIGALVSGNTGIIAMGIPLAFAAMQDGGVPLMVLLMCSIHAASQLSPTHVCLAIAADYYHISLGDLIKKNLPRSLLFCIAAVVYYNILMLVF